MIGMIDSPIKADFKCCTNDNCNRLASSPSLPNQKVKSCFTGYNSDAIAETCRLGSNYCALSLAINIYIFSFNVRVRFEHSLFKIFMSDLFSFFFLALLDNL
jgi:hypothetical protein